MGLRTSKYFAVVCFEDCGFEACLFSGVYTVVRTHTQVVANARVSTDNGRQDVIVRGVVAWLG